MNSDLQALIAKAKESLGAARILVKDGYIDFAASRAYHASRKIRSKEFEHFVFQ